VQPRYLCGRRWDSAGTTTANSVRSLHYFKPRFDSSSITQGRLRVAPLLFERSDPARYAPQSHAPTDHGQGLGLHERIGFWSHSRTEGGLSGHLTGTWSRFSRCSTKASLCQAWLGVWDLRNSASIDSRSPDLTV
jgi:hypothetical protein